MQRLIGSPIDFSSASKERKTIQELKSVFENKTEHTEILDYLLSNRSNNNVTYQLFPQSKKIIEEKNSVCLRLYRFNHHIEKLVRETGVKKEEIEFSIPTPLFNDEVEFSSSKMLHKHFKLNFSPTLLPTGIGTHREENQKSWLASMRNVHFFEMNVPEGGLEIVRHEGNGIHKYLWVPLS